MALLTDNPMGGRRWLQVGPAPWGRSATFHDPDGNGYVLLQSPSPAPSPSPAHG